MNDFLNVGKIVNTHGVRGEVRIIRITDFEERFEVGTELWIRKQTGELIKAEIDSHRKHKNFDLVRFKGWDNINDVEHLKGSMLLVSKENLGKLEEGEFYYFQIIGLEVYTVTDEYIGKVKEILSPGANDVWVVKAKSGKEYLIPYIDDIVKQVDIEGGRTIIEPMEGLLD
ncbi:16S rRNA processing protein RimM [Gracilibacillus halotolerans]|uniref:Ribosome maturation factor RimM n=1 Tax=Gracilibacillus halotolerans TaxID=74386 RepID=A0A841RHT4_9BACI|nr:16S rRNA processing protein RimM [Gracilibacillus halotolerans]